MRNHSQHTQRIRQTDFKKQKTTENSVNSCCEFTSRLLYAAPQHLSSEGENSGQNEVISKMWRVENKSKCAPRNLENSQQARNAI
jgi:hypothetical protein